MRFVITGGAGFIGSRFVELLLEGDHPQLIGAKYEVLVIDALTYAGTLNNLAKVINDPRLTFEKVNICDEQIVSSLINEGDIVINFAAESHVDRSIESPVDFIETNVKGVANLLKVSTEKKIKRFIQISTDEVYGSINEGSWDENSPVQPNSPYSASKAAADLLVLSFAVTYGIDVKITRCCNNLGPRQNFEKFIPNVIQKITNGTQPHVYGDGSNIREWIYVDDHCKAILNVALSSEMNKIYNIGSGVELTNLQLMHKIISIIGATDIEPKFVADRKGHDFRYSLNSGKYNKLFGSHVFLDFDLALRKTIESYTELLSSKDL